jgi:hypothetical protein
MRARSRKAATALFALALIAGGPVVRAQGRQDIIERLQSLAAAENRTAAAGSRRVHKKHPADRRTPRVMMRAPNTKAIPHAPRASIAAYPDRERPRYFGRRRFPGCALRSTSARNGRSCRGRPNGAPRLPAEGSATAYSRCYGSRRSSTWMISVGRGACATSSRPPAMTMRRFRRGFCCSATSSAKRRDTRAPTWPGSATWSGDSPARAPRRRRSTCWAGTTSTTGTTTGPTRRTLR